MMNSNRFNISNAFKGLEEAVDSILDDSDGEAEYDFVIIPPEPSVLTDEEEGADENMVDDSMPQDVPGNVEVFRCDNNVNLNQKQR